MLCPECGSDGPFKIESHAMFEVHDDGATEFADVEWNDDSFCECMKCEYSAIVGDFKKSNPDELEFVREAQDQLTKAGELEFDCDATVSRSEDPENTGAWVQAWAWMENPDCVDCGKQIKGKPIYGAGTSARCAECHKKRMEE
jgi:hypothetical protein